MYVYITLVVTVNGLELDVCIYYFRKFVNGLELYVCIYYFRMFVNGLELDVCIYYFRMFVNSQSNLLVMASWKCK